MKILLWPARPTFPEGPGTAVPGMCPTDSRSMPASSPSSTLVVLPTAGISISPTVTSLGTKSTGSGVAPFGWSSLAACGFSIARSDVPAARAEPPVANSNTATIVALRLYFLIENPAYIFLRFKFQAELKRKRRLALRRSETLGSTKEGPDADTWKYVRKNQPTSH